MNEPAPSRRTLKPPPNYNSRRVQAKLFLVVAACMGVLYVVTEGINRYYFPRPEAAAPDENINPRLDALPTEATDSTVPGAITIADPFRNTLELEQQSSDGLSRAMTDGWGALYQKLSMSDRNLFAKAFWLARQHKAMSEEEAKQWDELLTRCDTFWKGYRDNAAKRLAAEDNQLTPEEMNAWLNVLGNVAAQWITDRDVLASLAASEATEVTATRDERLKELQQRWDRLGLASIKDDTVHRPAETDAWFRLFEILRETPQAKLDRANVPSVSFIQLFKQPNDYRGKLVRIQGRVIQAVKFKPAKNVYGIQTQYLLWIRPEGSTLAPIVVYALELPPGFPSLDAPNAEGGYTKLYEDVEVTGYFFKRYAYRAQDGINTAPLILTKAPHWDPSLDLAARSDPLPSRWTFASWVLGSAIFALVVSVVAYARSRVVSPAVETFNTSPSARQELQASIDNAEAGPNVNEALKMLEDRDRKLAEGDDA